MMERCCMSWTVALAGRLEVLTDPTETRRGNCCPNPSTRMMQTPDDSFLASTDHLRLPLRCPP